MRSVCAGLLAALLLVALAPDARAQDVLTGQENPERIERATEDRLDRGWVPTVNLGASLSFSHARASVSAQSGSTLALGPTVNATFDLYRRPHEWRNSFAFRFVYTLTPAVDEWIKTADALELQSIYLYHVPGADWLGPYGLGRFETVAFPNWDVRSEDVNYVFGGARGRADLVASKLRLTAPFEPFILREAAGVFAAPIDEKPIKLEFRLGVGARQYFARGWTVGSARANATTGLTDVTVGTLSSYQQVGGEAFAGIGGEVTFDSLGTDRPLLYSLTGEVLMPFYSSTEGDGSLIDLTSVAIRGKLGIKLFAWMSLDYTVTATYDPLTVDAWQITNGLLLTFSYALVEPEATP